MRKRIYPKVRLVELLEPGVANLQVAQHNESLVHELHEAMRAVILPLQVRMTSYGGQLDEKNSDRKFFARDKTGSNIPTPLTLIMQYGMAISCLMTTPIRDLQFKEWIKQIGSGPLDAATKLFNVRGDDSAKAYAEKRKELIELLDASVEWADIIISPLESSKFKQQQAQIVTLQKLLVESIDPNPECTRMAGLILQTLILWTEEFCKNFDLSQKKTEVKLLSTRTYNVYQQLATTEGVFEFFERWYKSATVLTVGLEMKNLYGKVKGWRSEIHNGFKMLPEEFHDEMIRIAIGNSILKNVELTIFLKTFSEWKEAALRMSRYRQALKYERVENSISEYFDIFLKDQMDEDHRIEIRGEIDNIISEVNMFNEKFAVINREFVTFCDNYFTSSIEQILPQSNVRMCIHNGKKAFWYFIFSAPHIRKVDHYRVRLGTDIKDGKPVKNILVFDQLPSTESHSEMNEMLFDEIRPQALSKMADYNSYNGFAFIDPEVKNILIEAFKDDRVTKMNERSWVYERYQDTFTIDPPEFAERQFDIITVLANHEVRTRLNHQKRYTLRRIDLNDKTSILDLWFSQPRSEIASVQPSELEAMYLSRVNLFQKKREFGLESASVEWSWDTVAIESYSQRLSLEDSAFAELYRKHKTFRIRPGNFISDSDFIEHVYKNRKVDRKTMDRWFTVSFPILKNQLKSDLMLVGVKEGDLLYASPERRNHKPLLTISNKRFNDKAYSDCVLGVLTLDLTQDVVFHNMELEHPTVNTVVLTKKHPLSIFNLLDYKADDAHYSRITTTEGGGEFSVDDLYEGPVTTTDPFYAWNELGVGLLREIFYLVDGLFDQSFIKKINDTVQRHADELLKFSDEFLTISASTNGLVGGASFFVDAFKLVKLLEKVKKGPIDSTLLQEVFEFLGTIYGNSLEMSVKRGYVYSGSYYLLLVDMIKGVTRLPNVYNPDSKTNFITSVNYGFENACFNNPDLISALACYFTEYKLYCQFELTDDVELNTKGGEHDSKAKPSV